MTADMPLPPKPWRLDEDEPGTILAADNSMVLTMYADTAEDAEARATALLALVDAVNGEERVREALEAAAAEMENAARFIRADWEPRIADGFKTEAEKRLICARGLETVAATARAALGDSHE